MGEDASGGHPVASTDQAVLVAWSNRRRSPTRQFAALLLEGPRVRLVDADGETLIDADGAGLRADIISPTQIEIHDADGTVRYLVGPLPQWGKRGRGAELVNRYGAALTPNAELVQPEGRLARFMVTPATGQLRRLRLWPPVLLAMLRNSGVRPLDEDG